MTERMEVYSADGDRLAILRELLELLDGGFTGQVVLNITQGRVVNYEVRQTRRPGIAQPPAAA